MLSMALVVQDSLAKMLMPVMPPTPRSTLLSPLSASSLARSSMLSASGLPSPSVALDTVCMLAHIYATTTLKTSATLFSLASYSDAVQAFSGLHKEQ